MKKLMVVFLCLPIIMSMFAGCGILDLKEYMELSSNSETTTDLPDETILNEKEDDEKEDDEYETEVDFSESETDMFTERDTRTEYNENKAVKIELNGSSAKTNNKTVKISGSTITITEDTTYIISGTLDDGMIIVDTPDTAKLQLVFDEVSITSTTSAPIYIKEADKVFITLVGENTLTSGDEFIAIDDNNIDATVFSKQDLTFNGTGTLNINSPSGHGIVCKDDLVFTGGTFNIASASHGIDANDSVRIKTAAITVDAGKDGIHSENKDDSSKGFVYIESGTVKVECEGDGISSGSYIQIEDGTVDILAGGGYENGTKENSDNWGGFGGGFGGPGGGQPGKRNAGGINTISNTTDTDGSSSMKGLKSENSILISGGTFSIDSADDAIHSDISVYINGGIFEIASGDDALHAEENLTVSDGEFNITHCYEGLEALHIDVSGGDIKLVATDDGLNAAGGTDSSGTGGRDNMFGGGLGGPGGMSSNSNGSIVVSGGRLYINSSGDGMDANGTLEIAGGDITIVGPTQGDTATLDYDKTGIITGGTFIGTGSSMMAQTFSSSEQGVISVSVGSQSAGTKIVLKDKNGKEIVSYSPELSYQIVIISTPEMKSGETYTITVGTQSAEFQAS